MQVDGVEEELPDELENACSDDGKILKPKHSKYIILHQVALSQQVIFSVADVQC